MEVRKELRRLLLTVLLVVSGVKKVNITLMLIGRGSPARDGVEPVISAPLPQGPSPTTERVFAQWRRDATEHYPSSFFWLGDRPS